MQIIQSIENLRAYVNIKIEMNDKKNYVAYTRCIKTQNLEPETIVKIKRTLPLINVLLALLFSNSKH